MIQTSTETIRNSNERKRIWSVRTNVRSAYGYLWRLCAGWHVFQRRNNLTPVLQCFVIDWNRFKHRAKRAKKHWSKQWLKLLETAIKGSMYLKGTHKGNVRLFVLLVLMMTCFSVFSYCFLKNEKNVNFNRKTCTWIFCKRMKLKLCIE